MAEIYGASRYRGDQGHYRELQALAMHALGKTFGFVLFYVAEGEVQLPEVGILDIPDETTAVVVLHAVPDEARPLFEDTIRGYVREFYRA